MKRRVRNQKSNAMAVQSTSWWLLALLVVQVTACHLYWRQVDALVGDHQRRPPNTSAPPPDKTTRRQLREQNYYQTTNGPTANDYNNSTKPAASNAGVYQKCARQSIILARQMLVHELTHINQFNSFWFSDLDKDELIESQKHSLSNIVMSGDSTSLLNSKGQPLIEIESSYFKQTQHSYMANNNANNNNSLTIRLLRKHQDRCHLNTDRSQFSYTVGLSVGPVEHHLDVIYNLPKDLRLSQPIDWRYGQIVVYVPRMHYEVSFRQLHDYKLGGGGSQQAHRRGAAGGQSCPLEVSDVTFLTAAPAGGHSQQQQQQQRSSRYPAHGITITSSGLAFNNQTQLQIERLFDDYTRPMVSSRLRQLLRFYLNSKTFPLGPASVSF
jgi:hypothetical protein